jgi:ribosomal protein S18 acetylase RimI-like enzyme
MSTVVELAALDVRARQAEFVEVYRECFTVPPWSESEADVDRFAARLVADLGVTRVLVSTEGGRVAGFALLRPTVLPLPEERAYPRIQQALGDRVGSVLAGGVEVDELAVRPAARGRGVGRALLAAADTLAVGHAWLITAAEAEGARAFYRACGWREVGRSSTCVRDVVVLLGPG